MYWLFPFDHQRFFSFFFFFSVIFNDVLIQNKNCSDCEYDSVAVGKIEKKKKEDYILPLLSEVTVCAEKGKVRELLKKKKTKTVILFWLLQNMYIYCSQNFTRTFLFFYFLIL